MTWSHKYRILDFSAWAQSINLKNNETENLFTTLLVQINLDMIIIQIE